MAKGAEAQLLREVDGGIARAVQVLREANIETYESCEGGPGHAFVEPTVRFAGSKAEGWRAYAAAMENGLPVYSLRRVWRVNAGEIEGPWWEMTFIPTAGWWPT